MHVAQVSLRRETSVIAPLVHVCEHLFSIHDGVVRSSSEQDAFMFGFSLGLVVSDQVADSSRSMSEAAFRLPDDRTAEANSLRDRRGKSKDVVLLLLITSLNGQGPSLFYSKSSRIGVGIKRAISFFGRYRRSAQGAKGTLNRDADCTAIHEHKSEASLWQLPTHEVSCWLDPEPGV